MGPTRFERWPTLCDVVPARWWACAQSGWPHPTSLPKQSWLDWAAGCLQKRGPLDEATDLDSFMVT